VPPTRSSAFVHLQVHSHYSLLQGCCRIPDLIEAAVSAEMPSVALTDTDGMSGAIEFFRAAEARGIKPIIGCELNWPLLDPSTGHLFPAGGEDRVVLLAETTPGYHHLIRWVSASHLAAQGGAPSTDNSLAAAHSKGVIALIGQPGGTLARLLLNGDLEGALRGVEQRREIFGPERLYLMVQDHGTPHERRLQTAMETLSARSGVPRVVTQDVHYLDRRMAPVQDLMMGLRYHRTLNDPHRPRLPTPEYDFKTAAAMAARFPDGEALLRQAADIAARCEFDPGLGRLEFARYPLSADRDPRRVLWDACRAGMAARLGVADPNQPRNEHDRVIVARCRHELAMIEKTHFVNYFLVVADVVGGARAKGIPVGPGRGSGVGSLVAYLLGITDVDPLRYGLLFERLLNPERVVPPDFDIDLCHRRRGEVLEWVRQRYGAERVAQIVTFNTFGARAAMRDAARVLEIAPADVEPLIRQVPEADDSGMILTRLWDTRDDFRRICGAGVGRRILDYARDLEGLHRNAGTHASGLTMTAGPLADRVPLSCDRDGQVITQYAMDSLKALGLMKIDLLGLKTLTLLHDVAETVTRSGGIPGVGDLPPPEDAATFARISRGETTGVFQLESEGMRSLLRQAGIASLDELAIVIALYRPGPLSLREDYLDRKAGRAPVHYDHPLLEPILRDTLGVWIFQEQILLAAHRLAGLTLADGDLLRRALEDRDPGGIETQRARFIAGCRRTHHLSSAVAARIFESLSRFAGFGFNKAHSVSYALLAYRTAWMIQHHPQACLAALMTSEHSQPEKITALVREADRLGIRILGPDVNRSEGECRPEAGGIRYGLAGIRQVGETAARAIVAVRPADGGFADFPDFIRRMDPGQIHRRLLEGLIRSGALDGLGWHRARLQQAITPAVVWVGARAQEQKTGQSTFFDKIGVDLEVGRGFAVPDVPPWPESRLREEEREALGFNLFFSSEKSTDSRVR
jgi:DNA polymerase-3 subunit alpha